MDFPRPAMQKNRFASVPFIGGAHTKGSVASFAALALLVCVFCLQGAWPVPDVNEPYYVLKAIHFWNRNFLAGDLFLDSADSHLAFYAAFGWLGYWFEPETVAWIGRAVCWTLLAWAWWRFASAFFERWWQVVASGILFACFQARFHMAGEWVIGGVEGKCVSYVFVFLALEKLVKERWSIAFILLGIATAFHVLVGGWSLLLATGLWFVLAEDRNWRKLVLPLSVGGMFALLGLIPALELTSGADLATKKTAAVIYVFYRLGHHLAVSEIPAGRIERFLLLALLWLVTEVVLPAERKRKLFRGFVLGSLALAVIGSLLNLLKLLDIYTAAQLLRFYWFRLADVMLPMATACNLIRFCTSYSFAQEGYRRIVTAAVAVACGLHLCATGYERLTVTVPRADWRMPDPQAWQAACFWIRRSGSIEPDTKFLTPRMAQTFKWYARRAEVANWKDIPQDAQSIVRWWLTLRDVYGIRSQDGYLRWVDSLARWHTGRLLELAAKYDAQYLITFRWPRHNLPVVYENQTYVIYRLQRPKDHSVQTATPIAPTAERKQPAASR